MFKDSDGEEHPPSGLLVFTVFMFVMMGVVGTTVLIIRSIRYLVSTRCGTRIPTPTTDTSNTSNTPPQAYPTAGVPIMTRLSSVTGSLFNTATVAGTGMLNMVNTNPSVNNQSGYVPLNQDAEMITYPMNRSNHNPNHNPSAPLNTHVYTGIPVAHPPTNYRNV